MPKNIVRVSFKEGEKNMLIVSARRTGESKLNHKARIEGIKKIMIAAAHNVPEKEMKNLIKKYLP